jgi:hypothetical protein
VGSSWFPPHEEVLNDHQYTTRRLSALGLFSVLTLPGLIPVVSVQTYPFSSAFVSHSDMALPPKILTAPREAGKENMKD